MSGSGWLGLASFITGWLLVELTKELCFRREMRRNRREMHNDPDEENPRP